MTAPRKIDTAGAPTGVGLGLRGKFIDDVVQGGLDGTAVAFLEIAPENYMHRGGALPRQLGQIAERIPTITHGLMMSLGAADPLRDDYFDELRPFVDAFGGPWHSDHLCFSGLDGALLHDLLPLPHTDDSVRRVAARVREAADRLGRPMAVENISYYVPMGVEVLDEATFVRAVVEEADCGLLLDVNNVLVNAKNFGRDPWAWLERVPLDRVVQLHVAGHERWDEHDMVVDTHGATVESEVYAMMQWVIERTGPLPVLLERDTNIPPLAELVDEVARLDAAYREALSRRSERAPSAERHDA